MAFKEKIVNMEIIFEDGYGDNTLFVVDAEPIDNKIITKIKVLNAIFIYRKYVEENEHTIVEVIPFHQVKSCSVALENSLKKVTITGV